MGKYRHELQKFNSFDGFAANNSSRSKKNGDSNR